MFLRSQFLFKTIAFSLIFTMIGQVLFPTIAYALNSGPTAPEFSSFEPIDATDMVDLATGDFTYTLPVIDVPGPEGGYPLALSYHAGIQPEQEASWVGLGWTLNAGAINRYVSMLPDDAANDISVITDTWEGGYTNMYGGGIGVGPFHFGVSVASDTYKGIGVGYNASVTVPYTSTGNGGGLGVHIGANPYGGGYWGLSYTMSSAGSTTSSDSRTPGHGVSTALSVGYNKVYGADGSISDYFSANGQIGTHVTMGTSISTQGSGGASYGITNAQSSYTNVGGGSVSVQGSSSSITIPIPLFNIPIWVDFTSSYQRYFLYDVSNTFGYGFLYNNETQLLGSNYSKGLFDVYSLKGPNQKYADKDNQCNGGAFPAIDMYSVNAQGLGGAIQPYNFEYSTLPHLGHVVSQYAQEYSTKPSFRFVNDFSNSFQYDLTNATLSDEAGWEHFLEFDAAKVGEAATKYSDINNNNPVMGFDKNTNKLISSSHVEYYTNEELNDATTLANSGLILNDNRPNGFETIGYTLSLNKNIGAFKVTNKSGMTYHFSLPVYNLEETQKIIGSGSTRTIVKKMPYAYTWLLTAITGPDFVDRGVVGKLDNNDYGYWVKFDYGKWTDQYAYRTPSSGTQKDSDSEYETYSYGKKQLYYLNSVQTRTYTALFVKGLRKDSRGVTSKEAGGFGVSYNEQGNINTDGVPVGTLKLNKIVLCKNSQLIDWLSKNMQINSVELLTKKNKNKDTYKVSNLTSFVAQDWGSILDENDFSGFNLGKDIAVKQVVFNTDYSLCNQTTNSFDVNSNFTKANNTLFGKLTLNGIDVFGQNEEVIIPPTTFAYGNNPLMDNPNYTGRTDVWGNFKEDYYNQINGTGKNKIYQSTTAHSSDYVDAWSLKTINTPLGATISIDYESDRYRVSKFMTQNVCSVKDIQGVANQPNQFKVYLYLTENIQNIKEFSAGKTAVLNLCYADKFTSPGGPLIIYPGTLEGTTVSIIGNGSEPVPGNPGALPAQKGQYIIINSPEINTALGDRFIRATKSSSIESGDQLMIGTVQYDIDKTYDYYGGGVRVKSIAVASDEFVSQTNYAYEEGISSFLPIDLNVHYSQFYSDAYFSSPGMQASLYAIPAVKDKFRERVYSDLNPLLNIVPFIPSPGVVYSKVTVTDESSEVFTSGVRKSYLSEGRVEFNFSTANNLPDYTNIRQDQTPFGVTSKAIVQLTDHKNRAGLLKSVVRYKPNGDVLSSTSNTYLHDLPNANEVLKNDLKSQGIVEQVFRESKQLGSRTTYTKISQQPIVQMGSSLTDNQIGTVSDSKNIAFDFFSGDATASLNTDASGNQFLSVTTPAYRVYDNMGLKTSSISNKHMLSQSAGTVVFKTELNLQPGLSEYNVNCYSKLGLVSASSNVWKSDSGIPRLRAMYSWIGDDNQTLNLDGTYPVNAFIPFNNLDAVQNGWLLNNRLNAYDEYSHTTMVEDVNGNRSVMFMDPNKEFVTFSASNATTDEVAYTGVEYAAYYAPAQGNSFVDGNVKFEASDVNVITTGINVNTGRYALKVNSGAEGFSTTISAKPNRVYETSVWVYLPGEAQSDLTNAKLLVYQGATLIKEFNPKETQRSGPYYLLRGTFKASATGGAYRIVCQTSSSSTRALYFDDFFVKPINSTLSAFVYNPQGQLSHLFNQDYLYSRYEYDNLGNLIKSYQQIMDNTKSEYLVSKSKIHYGMTH